MQMLERLKLLLDITDGKQDALLDVLLANAAEQVLAYTRRTELPAELEGTVVRLALAAYNKMGAEGEQSHSEGGVGRSYEAELTDSIKAVLNRFIRARVM